MTRTTLMTKFLLPHRREDLLTRRRLLDRLYDVIEYKVVMISAPAGYGKTTLLVDFAADLEHPVCWYALDAGDCDPHVFLEHLVLSLQRRFPQFGARTLRALDAASGRAAPAHRSLTVSSIGWVQRPSPTATTTGASRPGRIFGSGACTRWRR